VTRYLHVCNPSMMPALRGVTHLLQAQPPHTGASSTEAHNPRIEASKSPRYVNTLAQRLERA